MCKCCPNKSANFTGTIDFLGNGNLSWSNVPIKIFIAKGYATDISVEPTKSHKL